MFKIRPPKKNDQPSSLLCARSCACCRMPSSSRSPSSLRFASLHSPSCGPLSACSPHSSCCTLACCTNSLRGHEGQSLSFCLTSSSARGIHCLNCSTFWCEVFLCKLMLADVSFFFAAFELPGFLIKGFEQLGLVGPLVGTSCHPITLIRNDVNLKSRDYPL